MISDFFRAVPKSRKVKIRGKQGIIFNNPHWTMKGLFYVATTTFVLAISYVGYLYYPLTAAMARFWVNQNLNTNNNQAYAVPTISPQSSKEYSITIPKIMAYSQIIADVPVFNREAYLKILEKDVVAQAKGSAEPGSGNGKSTYIFAHSTQQGFRMVVKNAVFYLLGELKKGDYIFINKFGKIYTYKVYKQQVVGADETKYLTYSEPDKEVLILQTCWPIGTDWNRLLVFAQLVK